MILYITKTCLTTLRQQWRKALNRGHQSHLKFLFGDGNFSLERGLVNFVPICGCRVHQPLRGQVGTGCVALGNHPASSDPSWRKVGIKGVRVGCRSPPSSQSPVSTETKLNLLISCPSKRKHKRKPCWFYVRGYFYLGNISSLQWVNHLL